MYTICEVRKGLIRIREHRQNTKYLKRRNHVKAKDKAGQLLINKFNKRQAEEMISGHLISCNKQ